MEKIIYLLRGLPNSGKTTLAAQLAFQAFAADDYWHQKMELEGKSYKEVFDLKLLPEAHMWCQAKVKLAMQEEKGPIAVHNTFTTKKELEPYHEMAKRYGYTVFILTVERHHEGDNNHEVPPEAIHRMASRWEHVDERFKR